MVDETIVEQIIVAINPQRVDQLIEIGPGLGALTKRLLPLTAQLEVIEIDREIIPKLEKVCAGLGELIIHNQDVLQTDFSRLKKPAQKFKIVGNLPYNISTPLLFHLVQYNESIESMFFMLQKEVVERICAQVGTKDYGRLTVMMQYFFTAQFLFSVPPESFKPTPKVDSAVLRLIPKPVTQLTAKNHLMLSKVVTQAFSFRRKTLRNALKNIVAESTLHELGISANLRPEQLAVEDYIAIANFISK